MRSLRRIPAALAATALTAGALLVPAVTASAASYGETVVLNEIESSGASYDWVELYNPTKNPVDLSGWLMQDNADRMADGTAYVFPAGTVLQPGAYLVVREQLKGQTGDYFTFGLGKGDSVRLYNPAKELIDEYTWPDVHAPVTYGRDAAGVWGETTAETEGAANVFAAPAEPGAVVLNEIDSSPADWVELYNPGDSALALAGFEIRDNSDDHRWQFPAGATIEPGQFLVVDAKAPGKIWDDKAKTYIDGTFEEAIGIGSADSIRLYDAAGTKLDEHSWNGHANIDGDEASATLGRCPDGTGAFKLATATPGTANECVAPKIAINEVESNGDTVNGDWVEIKNIGDKAIDISGWTLMDNDPVGHAGNVTPVPAGTMLEPGAYFVFAENKEFGFGLGKEDSATVRDADGVTVAEYAWTTHAAGVYGRCPDGTGDFIDLEKSTIGAINACGNAVQLSEIESSDGEPGDWIELVNPTDADLDISGLVVKDNDDTHGYTIPAGTVIPAGGYYVIEEADLGFGLGGKDSVRIFDGALLIQEYTWTTHATTTYAVCADGWTISEAATKGAANQCVGEVVAEPWPGSGEVTVIDEQPMFFEDTSGLDVYGDNQLYVVDNGTATIWLLDVAADGSAKPAAGWEAGKRVRYIKDADNPSAAGPDSEGITVDGAGRVYLGVERDNSNKGVTVNSILMVDPTKQGPNIVADLEWNLTGLLPQVAANTGIEAVEWVSNADLEGKLWDQNTNAPYQAANYDTWADGVFFVGIENNGLVYAVVLYEDGSAQLINVLDPKLGGVMALDYDTLEGKLWAVCDDGCQGTHATFEFNGTDAAALTQYERFAAMPNVNNEGFAVSPVCVDGQRHAWYVEDGVSSQALRTLTLPCSSTEEPQPTEQPGSTDEPGATEQPGSTEQPGKVIEPQDEAELPGLAETGAQNMTWVLWVAGALVVAGLALFVLRRRSNSDDAVTTDAADNE